jgi:hypothetical protein
MNSPLLLSISALGVALGAGGTWFAVSLSRKSSQFLARAIRVPATVVALIPTDDECVAPKYEFRDAAGVIRTAISKTGSYPAGYSLGQAIQILFDRESGESRIDVWSERRGPEVVVGFLSFVILAVGIGCLVFYVLEK